MDRILQNVASTILVTTYRDGVAENPSPDSATVIVKRSDGTTLASGSATDEGVGVFSYALDATDTADLDVLTADWTITFDSEPLTLRTNVEIVGGYLFSLADARALDGLDRRDNAGEYTYSTAQIIAARTLAETTIEEACGRAFVPRFHMETLNGTGSTELMLSKPDVRRIRSVSISSTDWTEGQLSDVAFSPTGLLTSSSYWTAGARNVTVSYEHGTDFPPPRVSQAALRLARSWVVSGPIDDRTSTFSTTEGGTYSLTVPGQNGSWTGLPEVDAVIDQYNLRVSIA